MNNKILTREIDVFCESENGNWEAYIEVRTRWNIKGEKERDIIEYGMYGVGDTAAAIIGVAKWLVLNHYDKDKTIFRVDDKELVEAYSTPDGEELDDTLAVIFRQPNFLFQYVGTPIMRRYVNKPTRSKNGEK